MPAREDELVREQQYVTTLYARLDELREQTMLRLREIRLAGASGTHQSRSERDAFATRHEDRLAQLNAVDAGLCFGRLDFDTGERYHVGRIGLTDSGHDTLLVDWRAPAAQPFYRATPAEALGLRRRRHLQTRGRQVLGVSDEVFDLESLTDADRATLSGEAALLAAVSAHRTGRMSDIVATIQSEQDRVIRAGLSGVLVVQGGPGTGKTAVALHRAAYLLYTHRQRLRGSGVLVVGPNPVFLRYIEQVLPSLGETGVLRATLDELVPGVTATGTEPAAVAAVKGDARMADVIGGAVRGLQRLPDRDITVRYGQHELRLTRSACAAARSAARRSRREHNRASGTFARALTDTLIEQLRATGDSSLRGGESGWLRRELLATDEVRAVLDECWSERTPAQLLTELYADPSVLAAAAGRALRPAERETAGPRPRRRLDAGRRTAAGRGRCAARRPGRGHPGGRAQARAGRGDPVRRGRAAADRPGRAGPGGCQHAGRPLGRRRSTGDGRGPGRVRSELDLRARDRGRGAGTVPDGLADAGAALPEPVDDAGR